MSMIAGVQREDEEGAPAGEGLPARPGQEQPHAAVRGELAEAATAHDPENHRASVSFRPRVPSAETSRNR